MSWSREQVSQLIEFYREHAVLYEVANNLYHNKHARADALSRITADMQAFRPRTTVDEVKTKINGLRTQFNKELTTMRNLPTGSSNYKVKLWCFQQLTFLQDHLQARQGTCNLETAFSLESQNTIIDSQELLSHSEDEEETNQISSCGVQNKAGRSLMILQSSRPVATSSPGRLVHSSQGQSQGSTSSSKTISTSARLQQQPLPGPSTRPQLQPSPGPSSRPPQRVSVTKRKRTTSGSDSNESELLQNIGQTLKEIAHPANFSVMGIGAFIDGELAQFRNPHIQRQCKRQLLRVLLQYQETDDEN